MSRPAQIAALLAAWTLAGTLFALQMWWAGAVRDQPIAPWRSLAIWLAWAYAWALLTPIAVWLAGRRRFQRATWVAALGVHLGAGVLLAALNLAMFAVVAGPLGANSAAGTWLATFTRLIGTALLLNVPVYWLLVGGTHAWHAMRAARERDQRALRLENQLTEARLLALRAQVEPHFLFNALNTVSVLMREDVEAADRVLVQLSALLRRSLDSAAAREVRLDDELTFVRRYLEIEQARFADRLTFCVEASEELLEARVPSLLLQPLVENAIRHGIARRVGTGHVGIRAERRGNRLQLTVRDDGPGMAPDAQDRVGLSNTRSRLELLYREDQSFEMRNLPGAGLEVRMTIPWRGANAP